MRHEFTLDRFTRGILCVITILLTVIAIELWVAQPGIAQRAAAQQKGLVSRPGPQLPDSGLQRNQSIDEARETNHLLGLILEHLRTKPIKAEMVEPDKPSGGRTGRVKW